jgi:glycerate 2-kinase
MARAAARILGDRIRAGVAIAGTTVDVPPVFEIFVGGHPLPTADSERAGRRALAIAESLATDETLLVLLSGGASALMAVPAEDVVPVTMDDKRRTTDVLLRAGADIHALNAVRKHLSAIKGGWLAARTPGRCHAFAVSDVVGDDLSVIASGPTVADASTFAEAVAVLRRFGGSASYPAAVVQRLEAGARGEIPETPKPNDQRLAKAATTVIGGRHDAMDGAAREATARGYRVVSVEAPIVGEARTAAASHFRANAAVAASGSRPACVVASGETTVRVIGRGKGGRNQEFALALADLLSSPAVTLPAGGSGNSAPIVAASVGTDGIDGPTDAAGAIVDTTTVSRAAAAGLGSPSRYLGDNNSYAYFHALGDLIHTGPTDTNVGDLQVILFA